MPAPQPGSETDEAYASGQTGVSPFGNGPKRDERRILAIRLELRSGARSLPEPLAGAIVVAFSFAEGPAEAAQKSFQAAEAKGVVAKVLQDGFSLPVRQWRGHVEHQRPEFAE